MEELRGGADVVLKKIMRQAAAERASDVHIEPGASFVRVRFRKDGLLSDRFCLSSSMAPTLSVRVKVLGRLDVGESRLPRMGAGRRRSMGCRMISAFLSCLRCMGRRSSSVSCRGG